MGMNNSGFGTHSMQQYGGIKRPSNQMNDGNMSKRPRPNNTGSWGSMGGDNSNNSGLQQQRNAGGNWYQDQGYNNSQQQSSYSWN